MEGWLDNAGTLNYLFTTSIPRGMQVNQGLPQVTFYHICFCNEAEGLCEMDDWFEYGGPGGHVYNPVNEDHDCRWSTDHEDCTDIFPHDSDCV
jgi:hypothetical protein